MVVKELMADPVVVDPMIGLVLHIPPVQQDREIEVAEVIEQATVQAAAGGVQELLDLRPQLLILEVRGVTEFNQLFQGIIFITAAAAAAVLITIVIVQ